MDTVDVSSYQNTMTQANYNTLKASGVKAVIVKASEGTTYTNPDASTQLTQAQNAGMKIAAYHYVHFSSTTTAAAEANYFAAVLNKLGVPKGSPVVADLESADVGGNVGSALNTFWSTLSSRGYTNHVLYTGKYYSWSNDAIGTVGQARTWIAQYPYQPRANNLLNTTYGAWQFSSQAKIAGYSSTLDASIDYTGLFTGSTVAPAPHGYDKVTSTRAINLPGTVDQSIRQDGFYSAPYNTDSMTTIENHNAKLFNGQTVQILQEATTSRSASAGNTFYQIRFFNGKTYWTDSRAIKVHSFYQESNTKNVNYKAKIAQAGRSDGLYPDGPYYTKLSNIFENSNAPRFNGQTVSVSQETTTPTGTYVRVTLNNGQVEWIDKKGITTDTYDKVTSSSQLNQVGRIEQAGRADGLYSAPYNTNAATVTPNSNAKLFNDQGVQILAKETTNRAGGHNTFYKLRLRNGNIHWIDADGVKLIAVNHITSKQALNLQGRINQAGRSDGLYSAPWNTDYLSIDENHNAPAFNGQTVQVKAEATTDRSVSAGNHFYQIKLSDGRLYWIDARGVNTTGLEQPTHQKTVNYTAVIWQTNRADGLYNHPYGSNADSVKQNTDAKQYNGRGVVVTAEATTKQGTYAKVTLPDGGVKWIDKRALTPITYDKITKTTTINKQGHIRQSGRSDGLYSAPYYTDAMSVLENHNALSFNNQVVQVLTEAITTRSSKSGNDFYQIRLANGRILWIDARGVKLN
ncbi:GW dipeptide domain-containing protein [Lacticaseibacillus sp. 53-4]|uniref:GW dipeptide domain-containing protein n=1 Tax=Lacticaseibacillus sp. 53-4 TaxID=2799575 RepID=UPI001944EEDD|nr:GW dipeptide domain-containing protein [Lacticaseibacillus sp. 53-4]